MAIIEANDENFIKEILQATVPVLVEFSKPGTDEYPDSRTGNVISEANKSARMKEIIDALATEYEERIKIVRVALDASPKAAELCGVTAAPALFSIQRTTDFHLKSWIKKRIDVMLD